MRIPVLLTLSAAAALHINSFAQHAPVVTQLSFRAGANVQALSCDKKLPGARRHAVQNLDPLEFPTNDLLRTMLPARLVLSPDVHAASLAPAQSIAVNQSLRIAVWGDSHLAAGFFTDELVKLLNIPADAAAHVLMPATMGKAGVRLPLRQSCVSSQWKYEPGYLGGEGAAASGPGLVNMYSDQPGATLAWDMRKDALSAGYERVRILYQQTEAAMVVGISVDGGIEQEVTLGQKAGPAVLELTADGPMAQAKLRLIEGRFRFHGIELASAQSRPFALDVFGYPGATVAGWRSAGSDYMSSWFVERKYDLVVLEFGTNEGNVKPFNLPAYRSTLIESVRKMKTVFPGAACILIAPGDRGVLVPRSANDGKLGMAKRLVRKIAGKILAWAPLRMRSHEGKPAAAIDLLKYSAIHAAIGRTQAEVAADAGCLAWSMQDAMGGPGSAYAWSQQSPALMSKDLIHFTVAGYRRLAQEFVKEMGWSKNAESAGVP